MGVSLSRAAAGPEVPSLAQPSPAQPSPAQPPQPSLAQPGPAYSSLVGDEEAQLQAWCLSQCHPGSCSHSVLWEAACGRLEPCAEA